MPGQSAVGGAFHCYYPLAFAKYTVPTFWAIRANTDSLTEIEISMCMQGSGEGQRRATRG